MKKSQIKKLIPKVSDLKKAHKAIFTADITDRLLALRKILDWLDVYIVLVRAQVIAAGGQRKLDLSAKIKPLAERHDTPPYEAETALLSAIRMLESALAPAVPTLKLPRIDPVWTEFEAKKSELEVKAAKATAKFMNLKASLERFFKPLGLTFAFKRDLPKPRQFDATGRVMYSFDYAGKLAMELKADGEASVLLAQAPAVLKAAAITINGGAASISMARLLDLLPGLLTSVHDLGAQSRSATVAPVAPKAAPTATTPPKATPSTPRPPKQAPAPAAGLSALAAKYFRAGMQQILFDRLVKSSGTVSMVDLYDGLQAGDPRRMILSIHQKGIKLGKWTAFRTGNVVHFNWTGGSRI